jgi:hypothetical protein
MIAARQKSNGVIARLKELLRYVFHASDDNIISFKERSIISPTITEVP